MSNAPRVLIVGFGTSEAREFIRLGVDVRAWIHELKRGDGPMPEGIETYTHYSVVRCETGANLRLDMPGDLQKDLYRTAFPLFRRHFHRIAYARNHHLKSWVHVDSLFHIAANFFYDLLRRQKIDAVLFSNFPHEGSLIILYDLARRLGIETILSMQSNFPSKIWIVRDMLDFGPFETVRGGGVALEAPQAPETPFYMNRGGKLRRNSWAVFYIVLEVFKLFLKCITLIVIFDRYAVGRNLNRLNNAIARFDVGRLGRKHVTPADLDVDFIYFPLHYQPELTTDTWGYEYGDQLLALEDLARKLPRGMKIYVKENPIQTRFMREPSFFRRLRAIPNTHYVSADTPSFELIRRSACVATIAGTAGWEASLMGKGVVIFGVTWYSRLPGVFGWSDPEALRKAMAHRGNREEFVAAFADVTAKLYPGVLDHGFRSIVPDYDRAREAARAAASLVSVLNDGRRGSVQQLVPDRTVRPDVA